MFENYKLPCNENTVRSLLECVSIEDKGTFICLIKKLKWEYKMYAISMWKKSAKHFLGKIPKALDHKYILGTAD